jgi:hypothetical protein
LLFIAVALSRALSPEAERTRRRPAEAATAASAAIATAGMVILMTVEPPSPIVTKCEERSWFCLRRT